MSTSTEAIAPTPPATGTPQVMSPQATPSQRYARLGGYTGGDMEANLSRMSGLLIGATGNGKSAVLQSNPKGFVFNLDSTTPSTSLKGVFWPGVIHGQPVDENGRPFILRWEDALEKLNILFELAKNNQPRPETIYFDTVSAGIKLLMDYVTRQGGKRSFKELHGPAAWDDVYTQIVSTYFALRRHGYGCWWVAHLNNRYITLADNRTKYDPDVNMGDGLWKRLQDVLEMVVCCKKGYESVEEPDPRVPGRRRQVSKPYYYVTTSDPDLVGILKTKVVLPDEIRVPLGSGWTAFEEAFTAAQRQGVST